LYAVPATPEARAEDAIASGLTAVPLMVIEMFADAFCAGDSESVAVTEKLYEPLVPWAGVPESTPLGLRFNPGGRAPELMDQPYGLVPPVALRVTE